MNSGPLRDSLHMLNYANLSYLLDINRRIFATIEDMDKTVHAVADSAKQFLNTEKATVWLFDPDENNKYLKAFIYESDTKQSLKKISVDQGIAGWVARNEQIVNIPDAYKVVTILKKINFEKY